MQSCRSRMVRIQNLLRLDLPVWPLAIAIGVFAVLKSFSRRMNMSTHRLNFTKFPDLDGLDLEGILKGLEQGQFTSQDLVEVYTSRIKQLGHQVHAIAVLNPEAKAVAAERDQQRKDGIVKGKLHGVPVLLKDIFITHDKMDTTGGSYALVGAKYKMESSVVTRLRESGAIIFGKTNLSQWGMARSPKCANGWSSVFGQALGPFHTSQDPQGSSSGSAIAASLGLAAIFLGGETCGSILYPAQRNSVVGLKPTVGLTSRAGTIPLNPEQDSIGPLSMWVKDAAIVLAAIAGKDENDNATASIPFDTIPDYPSACTLSGLNGMRIAVPQSVYKVANSDPEVSIAFRSAVEKVKSLGATVVDDIDFETWRPSAGLRDDLFGDIMLRESYEKFFCDLAVNPQGIQNISDLIEFTKTVPAERYDLLGAKWFECARDAPGTSKSEGFLEVKAKMERYGADVVKLLDHSQCDVLLATSSTDLPLDLGRLPGISVPLGFYSENRPVVTNARDLVTKGPNIPFAITFAGRKFDEMKLFACAYAFEQATRVVDKNKNHVRVELRQSEINDADSLNHNRL